MVNHRPPRVIDLVRDASFGLQVLCVAGGQRELRSAELQKPGLALAGHWESLHGDQVQVLGFSEISYLEQLDEAVAEQRLQRLCQSGIPCLVLTRGLDGPPGLIEACERAELALLRTKLASSDFVPLLAEFLRARLNPQTSLHGVLVDTFGVGVLLRGKSGIGKSEVALDLVMRGHRLVADDVVEVVRMTASEVFGRGPELIKHHMEIRGLGIINIEDLFGSGATRDNKRIELVVELQQWEECTDYDPLGIDDLQHQILGVAIPLIRLPVQPGRNIASLIEVAARNQLLKLRGVHSAREFQQRLSRMLGAEDEENGSEQ